MSPEHPVKIRGIWVAVKYVDRKTVGRGPWAATVTMTVTVLESESMRKRPPNSLDRTVSVVPATPGQIRAAVSEALEAVGWKEALGDHRTVLVKPNLGFDLFRPGAVTSAEVLEAGVELLAGDGLEVVIIEADQVLVDIEAAAQTAGVFELCRRLGPRVRWLNLSGEPFSDRPLPGALCLDPFPLPDIIGQHPMITVPVMKTHAKTTVSGALKNQWGLLPMDRYRYHPQVNEVLTDLLRAAPPTLCLMDATVCMEGSGPKAGTARQLDLVMAARDALRIDWAAAALMGFDPAQVAHLATAAPAGFGGMDDIELTAPLPSVAPFRPASHNLVSLVEGTLQAHPATRWVITSPLMPLLCGGARNWYKLRYRYLAR